MYYVEVIARLIILVVAIGLQADCIKNAILASSFVRNILSIIGFVVFGSIWCLNYIIVKVTIDGIVQLYQVVVITLLELALSSLIGCILEKHS